MPQSEEWGIFHDIQQNHILQRNVSAHKCSYHEQVNATNNLEWANLIEIIEKDHYQNIKIFVENFFLLK